jgi:tRNA (cmo5U34)-methyltransferase
MSHVAICRAIWGRAGPQEVKRLGVVISNLRKKLGGLSPYTIETVRSRGYGIVLGDPLRMTSTDPTGLHDWHSHRYAHEWIEAQGEARKEMERSFYLRRVAHLLPFDPEQPIRVLDIGAGYGALTKVILDSFPHSTVVVHDYSEPMLVEARSYLSGASDSVTYARGDLMSDDWHKDISGKFDAVVSSIAIHNVRLPTRIKAVYRDVFSMLSDGGCFFNVDYVSAPGKAVSQARQHADLMDQRYRLRQETGVWYPIDEVQRRLDEVAGPRRAGTRTLDPDEEPRSLENNLRWLSEAGFGQVECFWHDGRRALMGAFKT